MNDKSNQVPSEMSTNNKTDIEKVEQVTMKNNNNDNDTITKLQTINEQKRMVQDPPAPCITETDTTSFSDTDYDIENSNYNDTDDDTNDDNKLRQKIEATSKDINVTEAIDINSTDYTKTSTTTVPKSYLIILSFLCLAMVLIITITYTLYLKDTNDMSSITDQQNNASKNSGAPAEPTPTPPVLFDIPSYNNINDNNNNNNFNDSPVNPNNLCGIQYPQIIPLPGKKGIGTVLKQGTYNSNIEKITSLQPSWYYDWGLEPIPYNIRSKHNYTIKFVPMIWGKSRSNDELRQKIRNAEIPQMIANGTVTQVFGFNEPDGDLQANMTVAEAIERWSVLQELNVSLISPAPKTPLGEWFIEFMKLAQEKCLRIDSIAVHWYGPPNITLFQSKMRLYYQLYKLPISLTEFAVADWDAFSRDPAITMQSTTTRRNKHNKPQVLQFMKQAITWLEETEWILSYSWFMFENDSNHGWPSALFTQNNSLTTIGQYYKSSTVDNVYGNMSINYPM